MDKYFTFHYYCEIIGLVIGGLIMVCPLLLIIFAKIIDIIDEIHRKRQRTINRNRYDKEN